MCSYYLPKLSRLFLLVLLTASLCKPAFASPPPIPPVASFAYNATDTLWINSPSTLQNTSSNTDLSYWDIIGYNATNKYGLYSGVSVPRQCMNHHSINDCFLDTTKNRSNLSKYVFTQPGYYRVKLVALNMYGSDTYIDTVYVDTPSAPPVAQFLREKNIIGVYDFARMFDLSSNGPVTWEWYLDPPFINPGAPFYNSFGPNPNSQEVVLNAFEGGVFDVCLVVTNARGSDTLCKHDYVNIISGYEACKGTSTAKDTIAYDTVGAVKIATVANQYIPSLIASCSKGFTIAPCADTLLLYIDRLRLRDIDSLRIYEGDINGRILARYGGDVIPPGYTTVTVPGGVAFLQTYMGSTTGTGDSGYVVRWKAIPPSFSAPSASFSIPDTIWSGTTVHYNNQSTGKRVKYAWDTDGNNVYGTDNPSSGIDSITANPSRSFQVFAPYFANICLKAYNCVGADTACKTMWIFPVTTLPAPDFSVNATTGFTTDVFKFTDHSREGAVQWQWTFSPNNVTYVNGTNANSQHPEVIFYSPITYTVTLTVTNALGTRSLIKNNLISILSYSVPGCSGCPIIGGIPAVPSNTDIGISRVLLGDIDKVTELNTPLYHALQNEQSTTLYRGVAYTLMVARGTASDPMDMRAWIDFNRNTNFGDQDSEVVINTNNQNQALTTSTFKVPSKASIGTTRMRIGVTYGNTNITYNTAALGCFEDYGIEIGYDNIKPIVTLRGGTVVQTEIHKPFIDPKVDAKDNLEGDISDRYEVYGEVDTSKVGVYKLRYIARDYYDNVSDTVIRYVQVVLNLSGPTLTLKGPDTARIEVYHSYRDSGATAFTNSGSNISNFIQATGKPDTAHTGIYTTVYTIIDQFGFSATKTRWIIVHDTTKPVIGTLNGTDSILHQLGDPYLDPLKVTDNYCTGLFATRDSSSIINPNIPGTYTVVYYAKDCSNNDAMPFTVSVIVKDRVPPTASLNGANPMIIDVHDPFTDPWVTASDKYPPVIITTSGIVNIHTLGTDTIIYTIKDAAGNITKLTRLVVKVDREAPVLELLDPNPYTIPCHTPYVDPGVKIHDNYYTEAEIIQFNPDMMDTSELDMNVAGLYFVYFQVTDPSGNQSARVSRLVQVVCATGLDEWYANGNLNVYPNPTKGLFTISTKNNATISTLKILDMQGRLVFARQIDGFAAEVDIAGTSKGLYLIMLEDTDGQWYTARVMVD